MLSATTLDITPTYKMELAGRPNRRDYFEGVASKLEANVLCFYDKSEVSALVSLDSLFASNQLLDLVREKFKTLDDHWILKNLDIVSSHTHNAPALDPTKSKLGKVDSKYMDSVAAKISSCIFETVNINSTRSVKTYVGNAECALNVYRRKSILSFSRKPLSIKSQVKMIPDSTREVLNEIVFIVVKDSGGNTACVLWSWPCHPVASPNIMSIDSDFVGHVRSCLRKAIGHVPILYFPGFCGDIRPKLYLKRKYFFKNTKRRFAFPPDKNDYDDFVRELGICANSAISDMRHLYTGNISFHKSSFNIPLSLILESEADDLDEKYLEMSKIEFAGISLLLLSAEVCSPYASIIDTEKYTIVSGCSNQVFGYLPSDAQIKEGGYESKDSLRYFLPKTKYKQNIERHIQKLSCFK